MKFDIETNDSINHAIDSSGSSFYSMDEYFEWTIKLQNINMMI